MALSQPKREGEPPIHIFVNNGSIPDFGDVGLTGAPRRHLRLTTGGPPTIVAAARSWAVVS
jgi:hypothetical protein